MRPIDLTADELVSALMSLSSTDQVCILDSCGVSHLGSHLLIAGIDPLECTEISHTDPERTLRDLGQRLSGPTASIFSLSYNFGAKLLGIKKEIETSEPDVFIARFAVLAIHDYDTGRSWLGGDSRLFDAVVEKLSGDNAPGRTTRPRHTATARSNVSKDEYLRAVDEIIERIKCGDTYQTNLTQQISVDMAAGEVPATVFQNLRRQHPSPFAAFLSRPGSTVVSASPERFFRVTRAVGVITTSPIKGTRRRGTSAVEDARLRNELLTSDKDRAENTMIVDLLRNDIGKICEYGSVRVEKLCDLEEHPTLYHLVSTVSGRLRPGVVPQDIIRALFPCGSITGAPKISTMRIINGLESANRDLSMGAIGYAVPDATFGLAGTLDMSVAIRTMVFRDGRAVFNVGGGIVIDSDPESEYDETLLKAKALLHALGASIK